ncbi:hypothetical protein JCM17823_14340 [Halorubrum gandharaense]
MSENGGEDREVGGNGEAESSDDTPSVAARDDLAGVVDLFGALTREELSDALSELAFKARAEVDDDAIAAAIDAGLAEYYLVEAPASLVSGGDADADADTDATYLAVGPAAFPSLPPNAEDLPHILDVGDRTVDREAVAERVLDRLREEAEAAVAAGETERQEDLLDVTYDVELWAPVDAADVQETLHDALE